MGQAKPVSGYVPAFTFDNYTAAIKIDPRNFDAINNLGDITPPTAG